MIYFLIIIIDNYFKVVFPVYGFRLTIFRPFGEHDNFKVTSYNVASQIIYEWEIAQMQSGSLDLKSSILR